MSARGATPRRLASTACTYSLRLGPHPGELVPVVGSARRKAVVFVLGIDQAMFVEWDTEHAVMTVHRWSPQGGYSHSTRTYP